MALIRWEPARELTEVNRLLRTFFDTPTTAAPELRRWVPAIDVTETEDAFVLRADLPGLDAADVDIAVDDRVLTISGERTAEHQDDGEGYRRVERSFGSFGRALTLPEGVDAEQIAATFDKGVLEVRIPKPEQRRPHRVTIGAGPAAA